jgi:hypothetical protein
VTSTVLPTNVPTTGAEPAITMTESVWATVTADAAGAVSTAAASDVSCPCTEEQKRFQLLNNRFSLVQVEYCEDGDSSEDCVDEDSLPYCDEI